MLKIAIIDNSTVIWCPLPEEPPQISAYTLYFYELESSAYIFCWWQYGFIFILHSNFPRGLCKMHLFCKNGYRPFTVIHDFGTNWKHVCDFLLVRHSNLGLIMQSFRDIVDSLLINPPLFYPNFGGVPTGQDRKCWGQSAPKSYTNHPWNYFWSVLTCVKNISERHRWAAGQTYR